MTSMIDHDAPLPNRPKRDPYRGLVNPLPLERGQVGQLVEPVDPARTTVTSARGYDVRELDDAGRAAVSALLARHGIDERYVAEWMVVGRTRRGVVVGVTLYDHDERGDLVVVLGAPVARQVYAQCTADELPVAWRAR